MIHFFYPDDPEDIKNDSFYKGSNPDEMIMLFGGSFEKQTLIEYSKELFNNSKTIAFNMCLMHYRETFHALNMPCGEIKEELDLDYVDIFA